MMQELERLANDADAVAVEFDRRKNDAAMARKDEALRIAEAEAQLRKATLKADQSDELAASLEIATAEIDRSVAEIDLGHARSAAERAKRHDAAAIRSLEEKLAYYRGRVRELEDSIGRMMVKAPRAGTVIFPTGWSGDKKKVGDAAWRMETVLEIVSLDKMIGEGDVDEVDSSVVAVGQRVTLRLDAHADSELVGRVAEIANTVQRKSQADPSKVVRLEIELSETGDLPLRPGMRFRGLVETERAEGVLLMPAEAVFITPSGPIAYRRSNGGHEVVEIEIGRRNSRQVEVRKGLADGDQVSRVDIDREAI
jgi:multidrug resistance efflux pump